MRAGNAILRLLRCRSGAAAVEAAFALPVLLLVLLGLVELGRIALVQSSLNYAVQETARCASIRPDLCGTPELAASFAASKASAASVLASSFTLTSETCGKRVRAKVEHKLLYPLFNDPTLTAQFCRA